MGYHLRFRKDQGKHSGDPTRLCGAASFRTGMISHLRE